MYAMTFLISASLFVLMISCRSSLPSILTVGPVVRCLKSVASASGLPLYFSATDLYDGPSFLALTEWHLKQPLFFMSASAAPASAFCAWAVLAKARAAAAISVFILVLPFFSAAEAHFASADPRAC